MITDLSTPKHLEKCLRAMARKKTRGPLPPPKWARQVLKSPGFAESLSGFIHNVVKKGTFLIRPSARHKIVRKTWEQGEPEHLKPDYYKELSDDERSDYRVAYKLSVPDLLIHTIVGRFLGRKLETILSDHCYAYRRRRGQPGAVKVVRELQADQTRWIVKFDVKDFNISVDHDVLRHLLETLAYPLLDKDAQRDVEGAVEALFTLSRAAGHSAGKGLIVGSALTPALTNLYLTPLDRLVESTGTPFVRYGDDLVAFCEDEAKAQDLLAKLKDQVVSTLKQTAKDTPAFDIKNCWLAGLRQRLDVSSDHEAALLVPKSYGSRRATDVYPPGVPFDFIGFEFDGKRVSIRQATLAKIKKRIEQYTQRSKRRIEEAVDNGDFRLGSVVTTPDHDDEIVIASPQDVQKVIQRINRLLGFISCPSATKSNQLTSMFFSGFGFPWNILKCVGCQDVQKQFALLDAYAYHRLQRLAGGLEGAGITTDDPILRESFPFEGQLGNRDLRAMGLKTFKDVANRFPPI